MPAFTAPLQSLASKLVKSRHSLHATNLQCEGGRTECDKARQQVEANDAEIAGAMGDPCRGHVQLVYYNRAIEPIGRTRDKQ